MKFNNILLAIALVTSEPVYANEYPVGGTSECQKSISKLENAFYEHRTELFMDQIEMLFFLRHKAIKDKAFETQKYIDYELVELMIESLTYGNITKSQLQRLKDMQKSFLLFPLLSEKSEKELLKSLFDKNN
jgi:hypothetical protein